MELVDLGVDEVIAFRRHGLVAAANLADRPVEVPLAGRVLYDTHDGGDRCAGPVLRLLEAQAVVLDEV